MHDSCEMSLCDDDGDAGPSMNSQEVNGNVEYRPCSLQTTVWTFCCVLYGRVFVLKGDRDSDVSSTAVWTDSGVDHLL